jgi:hypothetical protein
MRSIIDTFNVSDYFFIFLGAFLISVIICPFITFPEDGWETVIHFVELYILTLIVFGCFYGYLKTKSKEMTHLTQEKLYLSFFLILAVIVVFTLSREIFSRRNTTHGFILMLIAIVFVLICFFVYHADSAISERYSLNQPLRVQGYI